MLWLAAVALVPLVSPQCLTPADDAAAADLIRPKLQQLYKGQMHFSLSMLQNLSSLQQQSNLLFSPLGVYSTLLMAYFISSNHTEKALQQTLYLPPDLSKGNVLGAYNVERLLESIRSINSSGSYRLINAKRLFVAESLPVRECMQGMFHDEMEKVDFKGDVGAATEHINQWMAKETIGRIHDLIPAGRLSLTAKLMLANTAYFKGLWKSKFHAAKTKKEIFHISRTVKSLVTMMRQKGAFNHLVSEQLGAHVLQLPYKSSTMSMFVFLPPYAAPQGVNNIIKRLTPENLHEIFMDEAMIPRLVEVGLPRFSEEQFLELVPILASMGVGDLFNASADLSALTGGSEVQLDDAVHKAKLEVDDEGTTAAAVTFYTFRSSRPINSVMFICNHPFVYLLYEASTQTILFAGVYRSPPPSG